MNSNFINRIFRAARLDAHLYEEVEADKTSMRQAMLVVILSGVAAGVGSYHMVDIWELRREQLRP